MRNFLKAMLPVESRAYGFTIAFWGSGMVLIGSLGTPSLVEVLSYASGAVLGFGILAALAFSDLLENVRYDRPEYLVLSMVHYLAALAPILVTAYLTRFGSPDAFLLSGISVTVVYNLLMAVEELISEEVLRFERKFFEPS